MTAVNRRRHRRARGESVAGLRARLAESEATLRAIRTGGVDALVVAGKGGPRVFTLRGAEHSYRVLIESMNEGALMLSPGALILYANRRFAQMVRHPLSRILGFSFRRFLSQKDQALIAQILAAGTRSVSTIQMLLNASGGLRVPVQVSIHRLSRDGDGSTAFSLLVTDMTEARRNERTLRSLSQSLLQAQESDRRRVAVELHDRATQGLGALLIRLHLLAANLPARSKRLHREVREIGELVGKTAEVVETISRGLRPSVLEILGLVPALRAAASAFTKRTGIAIALRARNMPERLPPEIELTLYRAFEEAVENVREHARARHVTARLQRHNGLVSLAIRDDGSGFDPQRLPQRRKEGEGMGLIGLRERVASVGGALALKSARGMGTTLTVRVPLAPAVARLQGSGRQRVPGSAAPARRVVVAAERR